MGKKPSPAYEFVYEALKTDPTRTFESIRAAGEKKGLKIIPIIYGRAQKALGLSKTGAPAEGTGDKPKRSRKTKKARETHELDEAEGFMSKFRQVCSQRDTYRRAFDEIRKILDQIS